MSPWLTFTVYGLGVIGPMSFKVTGCTWGIMFICDMAFRCAGTVDNSEQILQLQGFKKLD